MDLAPRPGQGAAALAWSREHLFAGWGSSLITLGLLTLLVWVTGHLLDWAVLKAQWRADAETCRALDHAGACWGVIAEKHGQILFGRYPHEQMWRPMLATLLLLALLVLSFLRPRLALILPWVLASALFLLLMGGGAFGLSVVGSERWGGLPLTLLLSLAGMAGALPLGILLALGRQAQLPAVAALCRTYIELVRGVPLVSLLFLASFLLPLFLPQGMRLDVLSRVLIGLILFAAAYLAEVVRGGLQAVPETQRLAAAALGLGYWQTQRSVVLPQALRLALPALMNSFIATIKETSVVTVVSLYELTGALSLALSGDADWRAFFLEGYLFIAAIYWALCFALSRFSRRWERS